jgi:type VI protein secretion system component Hcp
VIFITFEDCNEGYGAHFPTGDTIMDTRKIDLRGKAQDVELSEEQLSSVSGGKAHDKASPVLMKACATGEHLREATITH